MRSLAIYRRLGIWRALLLDGSTVIARRYGMSLGTAMRRGIDANLKTGGPNLKVTGNSPAARKARILQAFFR